MSKIRQLFRLFGLYRWLILGILAFIFLGFVGENSYMAHIRNQRIIRNLKEEIRQYKEQYTRDNEQLRALDTDVEAMRRIARERYFMKAANEDVFIIEE